MNRSTLLFLEGLNTGPKPNVYWGPLYLGPYDKHWRNFATTHGFSFFNFSSLGPGTLQTYADGAVAHFLRHAPADAPIHLIGHSMGGLLARAVTHGLAHAGRRVLTCTSIGTPYTGSPVAMAALKLPSTRPGLHRLFKTFGYDTGRKLAFYENLARENVAAFLQKYPMDQSTHYSCIVGSVPLAKLPAAFQVIHRLAQLPTESDGLVEASSQVHGEVLVQAELDHFAQLGYVTHMAPHLRRHTWHEFQRAQGVFWSRLRQVESEYSETELKI